MSPAERGGRLEVQGIVSVKTGEPLVQFRQLGVDGNVSAEWQAGVADAREMAQQVVEATMNAVYDAALVEFVKRELGGDDAMVAGMLTALRRHRADAWGLPDLPEDWRG